MWFLPVAVWHSRNPLDCRMCRSGLVWKVPSCCPDLDTQDPRNGAVCHSRFRSPSSAIKSNRLKTDNNDRSIVAYLRSSCGHRLGLRWTVCRASVPGGRPNCPSVGRHCCTARNSTVWLWSSGTTWLQRIGGDGWTGRKLLRVVWRRLCHRRSSHGWATAETKLYYNYLYISHAGVGGAPMPCRWRASSARRRGTRWTRAKPQVFVIKHYCLLFTRIVIYTYEAPKYSTSSQ